MKIKELQGILKKRKIDFALFYSADFGKTDDNMLYFSQYGGIGALVIPSAKKPFLIVPKMELKAAKEGLIKRVYCMDKKKRLFENALYFARKNKVKTRRAGIDKNSFSLNACKELRRNFKRIKTIDVAKDCLNLRETKTKKEIAIIKRGCAISDKIMNKCFKEFKRFKTESDVLSFLEYEAKKEGCGLAFPTIVASGRNAVKPHHETKKAMLQKGFCVIDFGIRYKNYCTDTTRTIYLGRISAKEREIYNFLLDAQKNIIKGLKINKSCSEAYSDAVKSLGAYNRYFMHGLGHGFGINIHELPNLTEKSMCKIRNNAVFTVEPGIYLKNYGIRTEDDVLIEDNKVKTLTKATKELVVIGGRR